MQQKWPGKPGLFRELKEMFDFMHLENPDRRAQNIEELVKGLNEDCQRIIYKIVRAFDG